MTRKPYLRELLSHLTKVYRRLRKGADSNGGPQDSAGLRANDQLRHSRAHPRFSAWRGFRDVAALTATLVFSTILAFVSSGLRPERLGIPLLGGDLYFSYGVVRGMLENGWYVVNDDLGAPFTQDLRLFPLLDATHLSLIKLVGLGTDDPVLATNLYFLAGYPLAGGAAYLFLRLLGCQRTLAIPLAVSYAIIPWHLQRAPHLFLASYWVVPLGLALVLLVGTGRWDSWIRQQKPAIRRAATGAAALMAIAVALGGIYYAAMLSFLLILALILRSRQAWMGPSMWIVGFLAGTTVTALLLASWLAQQAASGGPVQSAFARAPGESEIYGGRLITLLLPWPGSRFPFMSELRHHYDSSTLLTSQVSSWHGLIQVTGTWLLLGIGLLHLLRGRREARPVSPWGQELVRLSGYAILITLAFVTTGLGAVFAFTVAPEFRGWDRFSIFIAMLATAAVGLLLQAALARLKGIRRGIASSLTFVVLSCIVLVDQTNPLTPLSDDGMAAKWDSTNRAMAEATSVVPRGCMVMQYPIFPFPGEPPRGTVSDYDQMIPYIATGAYKWSYGGVRGSLAGDWPGALERTDPERFLAQIVSADFCILEVLSGAVTEEETMFHSALIEQLGTPIAQDAVNSRTYYDLRPLRAELLSSVGTSGITELRDGAIFPILAQPVSGVGPREVGPTGPYTWLTESRSRMAITNSRASQREVTVSFTLFAPPGRDSAIISVGSAGRARTLKVGVEPRKYSVNLQIPSHGEALLLFDTVTGPLNVGNRLLYAGLGQIILEYDRGPLDALNSD